MAAAQAFARDHSLAEHGVCVPAAAGTTQHLARASRGRALHLVVVGLRREPLLELGLLRDARARIRLRCQGGGSKSEVCTHGLVRPPGSRPRRAPHRTQGASWRRGAAGGRTRPCWSDGTAAAPRRTSRATARQRTRFSASQRACVERVMTNHAAVGTAANAVAIANDRSPSARHGRARGQGACGAARCQRRCCAAARPACDARGVSFLSAASPRWWAPIQPPAIAWTDNCSPLEAELIFRPCSASARRRECEPHRSLSTGNFKGKPGL